MGPDAVPASLGASLLGRIDKQYDPFASGDRVIKDMKAGMETLLEMHNPCELASLCGALSLLQPSTPSDKKAAVMQYIREGRQQVRTVCLFR